MSRKGGTMGTNANVPMECALAERAGLAMAVLVAAVVTNQVLSSTINRA